MYILIIQRCYTRRSWVFFKIQWPIKWLLVRCHWHATLVPCVRYPTDDWCPANVFICILFLGWVSERVVSSIILVAHGHALASVSSDTAQSVMYTVGRIHNGLRVVFCFVHVTPSHYHHHADLLTCIEHVRWKILEACVNVCWAYSVESVFKMWLILSVTLFILFAMCGVVYVKLAHSSLGDRGDVFGTHLIIIIE